MPINREVAKKLVAAEQSHASAMDLLRSMYDAKGKPKRKCEQMIPPMERRIAQLAMFIATLQMGLNKVV